MGNEATVERKIPFEGSLTRAKFLPALKRGVTGKTFLTGKGQHPVSQFRIYFYDLRTRTEMTDYAGNGKTWLASGGNVMNANREFVKGTADSFSFCSYGSLSKVVGETTVTAADFPHPVAVKVWFGPNNIEWRKLVAPDAFKNSTAKSAFASEA